MPKIPRRQSSRLLLVTGAGASANLGPEDRPLPLMGDWAERLRAKIGGELSHMTGLAGAEDGVAFEETLGALFRWLDGLDTSSRFMEMTRNAESRDGTPDAFAQGLANARRHGERFREFLHTSLFEEFGPDRIDPDRTVRAYRGLFEALGSGGEFPHELICATTNYDRSLEVALEALGTTPRTGFVPHAFQTPILDPRELGSFGEIPALLYLHGAVGWYRDTDGSIQAQAADKGYNATLGSPAVLYPSPSKAPEVGETAALWSEFQDAVTGASHILVLGHGLNDTHLLQVLRSTPARIAVTYHSEERATAESAEYAKAKEDRIKQLLPGADTIAITFGPDLAVDGEAMKRWCGPSPEWE